MTEKTTASNLPVLTLSPGFPAASAAFLQSAAALAGWDVAEAADKTAAAMSLERAENRLVVTMPGKVLHFDLPLRPGKLIAALSRLAGEITLPPVIALGTYTLLPHDFILQKPDGEEIKLTEKEISILLFLYNNQAQAPISRQALLDGVWAYADGVETHTLETHIYRLRQKIEEDPAQPSLLVTEEDGYRLAF